MRLEWRSRYPISAFALRNGYPPTVAMFWSVGVVASSPASGMYGWVGTWRADCFPAAAVCRRVLGDRACPSWVLGVRWIVGLWKTSLPLKIWLADCSSLLAEATMAERLAWLGSSRLCTYESLLSCLSWPWCRLVLKDRRALLVKLRRGDSECKGLWFTSTLRLVNGRKPSKLVRGWSLLGRGLGDDPRLGDIGERVALTPSLILTGRRAVLASCSRIPLRLVLFEDSALDVGSAWSLGPWSWDDESSIRILRTLMASFPKEKNEKKYCHMSALATGTVP